VKVALGLCISALLLLVGCGSNVEEPLPAATNEPAIQAPVTTLALTSVDDMYEAVGSLKSMKEVTLSAKVAGDLVAVLVDEGDSVRAGQLLAEIDSRDLTSRSRRADAGVREAQSALQEVVHGIRAAEAARTAADANLRLATSTLERFETLRERRAVSPHEFEEVEARQQSAQAELDRANASLDALYAKREQVLARIEQAQSEVETSSIGLGYTQINAPMAGVVRKKFVERGAQAAPGLPLLTLESREYEITAAIPESYASGLGAGTRVSVSVPSLGVDGLETRVTTVIPTVDPSTRSYEVKLAMPRQPAGNRPESGMFVRVHVPVGEREILAVPASAIVERGQLTSVFVVDDSNVIRARLIKTGERRGDQVEVLSGLAPGDRAILERVSSLRDGAQWQP